MQWGRCAHTSESRSESFKVGAARFVRLGRARSGPGLPRVAAYDSKAAFPKHWQIH